MAIIQLGPVLADIAGSVAGSTFQRSRAGHLLRTKPLPTLRRSRGTNPRRQDWQYNARLWRSLSQGQRASWNAFADTLPWTNRFGVGIRPAGYWMFMHCNQNLSLIRFPPLTSPGLLPVFPPIHSAQFTLKPDGTFTLDSWDPFPIPSDFELMVYTSPPTSRGVGYPPGGFRYTYNVRAGEPPAIDLQSPYNATHPVPVDGYLALWVELKLIHTTSGMVGPAVRYRLQPA